MNTMAETPAATDIAAPRPVPSPHHGRPLLAIVTGHLTPYRIAIHRRIATELPGLRLATLVTKYQSGPWINPDVPEIGTVKFDTTAPTGVDASIDSHRHGRTLLEHLRHEHAVATRVRGWLEEHRPAAIICGGYDEIPVMTALRWSGRRRVPAFLWTDSNVHGDRSVGWKRRVKDLIVPRICQRYRGVLVCGKAGRQFFHRYGVSDDRMFVMPLEPDYKIIDQLSDAESARLVSDLQFEADRRRLVFCGRLIPLKRVDLVIEAFKAIADERPDWDLIIVGKGDCLESLQQQAGNFAGPRGRIRFVGWHDAPTIAAINRHCHAMVLASNYEAWSLVVNEAAACGLAILSSDRVGAAYELVKNGENGFVFPPDNLEKLTEALRLGTDNGRIGSLQAASRREIARWRREADPIQGLKAALTWAKVLSP